MSKLRDETVVKATSILKEADVVILLTAIKLPKGYKSNILLNSNTDDFYQVIRTFLDERPDAGSAMIRAVLAHLEETQGVKITYAGQPKVDPKDVN